MPDLHAWITQQVDECEQYARTEILNPVNALRRCEADRQILAAHPYTTIVVNPSDGQHTAGFGCETCHDWDGVPEGRGNCPTLIALAYAHGITDDILASLDQPETPPRPDYPGKTGNWVTDSLASFWSGIPMAEVPPALRGPNWKP